jgi:hypothetical protein
LNKLESRSPKDNLFQVWLNFAGWFWRRRFKNEFSVFYSFAIISPWIRVIPFVWTKVNPLHPRIICIKFDWIWPPGFRQDFKIIFSVFSLFRYYLSLEKGYSLHLNKLESPLPMNDLCQVWLKLALWFWRRRFLNDPTPFLHFCNYLPFEDDLALYLSNLNLLHPRIICTNFDWIWPADSGEKDFKKFLVYFYSFAIISPWRRTFRFIWTNLNPLHLRMICAKSG